MKYLTLLKAMSSEQGYRNGLRVFGICYGENVINTDESLNVQVYIHDKQKCLYAVKLHLTRMSKIYCYESPYTIIGGIQ